MQYNALHLLYKLQGIIAVVLYGLLKCYAYKMQNNSNR